MARKGLIALFVAILGLMSWVTVTATLERGVFEAGAALWPDGWFRATLADAYCGFVTFFCWVAYKERSWWARLAWLVAILALGNFAMAAYALKELWRWRDGEPAATLLLRRPAR
jgi:hypothetical protein